MIETSAVSGGRIAPKAGAFRAFVAGSLFVALASTQNGALADPGAPLGSDRRDALPSAGLTLRFDPHLAPGGQITVFSARPAKGVEISAGVANPLNRLNAAPTSSVLVRDAVPQNSPSLRLTLRFRF